jgi:hypothetical protein
LPWWVLDQQWRRTEKTKRGAGLASTQPAQQRLISLGQANRKATNRSSQTDRQEPPFCSILTAARKQQKSKTSIMPLASMTKDSIQDLTSLLDNHHTNNQHAGPPAVVGKNKKNQPDLQLHPHKKLEQEANPQQPPSFRYTGQYEYSDGYYYHQPPYHSNNNSINRLTATSSSSNDAFEFEDDDDDDNERPAAVTNHHPSQQLLQARNNNKNNNGYNPLLGCLFPWIFKQQQGDHDDDDDQQQQQHNEDNKMSDDDGSATSNNSNLLGEKLSQRERLAVLNRLGLPPVVQPQQQQQPQHLTMLHESASGSGTGSSSGGSSSTTTTTSNRTKNNNLLNGIPVVATSPLEESNGLTGQRGPIKGILKRSDTMISSTGSAGSGGNKVANPPKSPTKTKTKTSTSSSTTDGDHSSSNNNNNNNNNATSGHHHQHHHPRRSLFPTTYEKRTNKAVSFAPMARVVTVKSKNDMDADEKWAIWWQRTDYDEFRRTGRIITKSNNINDNNNTNSNSPHHPAAGGSPLQLESKTADPTPHSNKWWHNFGHSRRGLEHVVSSDEGRQRQQNVKLAIAAVLKEQTRTTTDTSEKLRAVSLNYTSWARDLALAAAASDADAVARGFGEDRKSREFFLLKQQQQQQRKGGHASNNSTSHHHNGSSSSSSRTAIVVPDFMHPRTKTKLQQRLLDANISRRPVRRTAPLLSSAPPQQQPPQQQPSQPQQQLPEPSQPPQLQPVPTSSSSSTKPLTMVTKADDTNDSDDNVVVDVVVEFDSDDDGGTDGGGGGGGGGEGSDSSRCGDHTSMAQQAAGFAAGGQKQDMAAVLAGAAVTAV